MQAPGIFLEACGCVRFREQPRDRPLLAGVAFLPCSSTRSGCPNGAETLILGDSYSQRTRDKFSTLDDEQFMAGPWA